MSKKKVLFVTQEMEPYAVISEISSIARKLPQYVQEKGMEIRILMPRFGTINERRHRLHEVVRLSGMNIIVDDDDFPLIIKVASLPGARMQVYFLDNEDFFKRKSVFENDEGKPFADNADRMVFFCKGVIETVRKFGWAPDIVHCHGWMTSLIPLYLKIAYKAEALFQNSKVIYSVYNNTLEETFDDQFIEKASINNLTSDDLGPYHQNGSGITLHQGAIHFSDALIQGSEELSESIAKDIEETGKPALSFQNEEEYLKAYLEFYKTLMEDLVEE
ncbi:MAG: glycogen/starch synthase [Bacteroidetes bacterium]|nr:glycogen/starch synthase [Bacteroidota bacterium]